MRQSFFNGVLSIGVSKYFGFVVNFTVSVILARILTPSEFGTIAIAITTSTFLIILTELGVSTSIVQTKELTQSHLNSLHSIMLIVGLLIGGLLALFSKKIGFFFNDNELTKVLLVFSLYTVFFSTQVVPKATLNRNLEFLKIGYISIISQIFSALAAIIMALNGFGVYALAAKYLIDALFAGLLFNFFSKCRITFMIDFKSASIIYRYTSNQFLFNCVNFFGRNSDNILIGRSLGSFELGLYDRSYQLMHMPNLLSTQVLNTVLHPILSKRSNNINDIYLNYFKIFYIISVFGFPISILMFSTSHELITLIYGPQWSESISIFKPLALSCGFQMAMSTTGPLFQSTNRTDILLYTGLINTSILILGIFSGIFFYGNIQGVANALLLSFTINYFITFKIVMNKIFKLELIKIIPHLKEAIIFSILTALAIYLVDSHINNFKSLYVALILKVAAALTTVIIFIILRKDSMTKKLMIEIKNGLSKK